MKMIFLFITFKVLLLTVSFGIHVTSSQISSLSRQTIHLHKCCGFDEEYLIGFDQCGEHQDDVLPQELNPPIDNTVLSSSASQNIFKRFNTTYNNIISCENGYVANISLDFQLFSENGSLLILPQRIVIPEHEFCIDQYQTFTNPENKTALVVRYCAPDPCINRHCIRKCCPFGMVLNKTDNRCQKVTENLRPFQLRNEFGVAMILPTGEERLAVRDAAYPKCQHGTTNLVPDSGDCFSILRNGTIFVPQLSVGEQYSDQYCVDYLVGANKGHRVIT